MIKLPTSDRVLLVVGKHSNSLKPPYCEHNQFASGANQAISIEIVEVLLIGEIRQIALGPSLGDFTARFTNCFAITPRRFVDRRDQYGTTFGRRGKPPLR